jgi:hypothetical protein
MDLDCGLICWLWTWIAASFIGANLLCLPAPAIEVAAVSELVPAGHQRIEERDEMNKLQYSRTCTCK